MVKVRVRVRVRVRPGLCLRAETPSFSYVGKRSSVELNKDLVLYFVVLCCAVLLCLVFLVSLRLVLQGQRQGQIQGRSQRQREEQRQGQTEIRTTRPQGAGRGLGVRG
jgi:hypothetical protein